MKAPTHSIPYGTAPWHQGVWDWRAAGNFICGGIGSGLVAFSVISGATGLAQAGLLLLGLTCIGAGLASVSLELGRPLRALNVFRNPRTSWMSREAIVAAVLAATILGVVAGIGTYGLLAGLLALLFVYCQARILQAAKGIPAWHAREIVPLIGATALTEGAGLFWLLAWLHGAGTPALLAAFALLLVVRAIAWQRYSARLDGQRASAALVAPGRMLLVAGTLVPLGLVALAAAASAPFTAALAAVAGLAAILTGAYVKFAIVTRAGFNRGFAMPALPVRGARA